MAWRGMLAPLQGDFKHRHDGPRPLAGPDPRPEKERESQGKWRRDGGRPAIYTKVYSTSGSRRPLLRPRIMTAPRITVVDDDASVPESMSSLLRSVGHVVHEFASGEE